ncbi:MAG TPA: M14 family zinc carboxypeptidase [Gemmatimonadales bacterium]|nr:M14 family zinc carboxypeptidase [Gemmatimonadales bacterium]
MSRRLPSFVLCLAVTIPATSLTAQQTADTTFARLVREYTTDPRFLPASVAALPLSTTIPSPQRHFGTIAGAPGVMHHSEEVYGYFRALAAATPRVRVETVGKTEQGCDIVLVVIADSGTLARTDAYRATLARLADPRTVPAASLDSVLAVAKPVYYLNGGLHSTEMGSPEMLMELAYRLAASDEPAIRRIREGVITLINPVSEPDGRDRQVDWYLHYTKSHPTADDGFPRSSPFWGDYAFHDNNRDGLQMALALTRAIYKVYYDWHPLVMHDLHESIPLLYVSTGTGPYNEHNDPVAVSEWQLFANNDITALDAQGLPGVWTWAFFDGWWPGYAIWVANNHNAIGRFYETFGNAGANTYVRDLSDDSYAGDSVTSRQWYRPWPPTKKVRWSARDNVNYMEAGVLASLTFTAENAERLLRNFWQKGTNSITRGRTEKPYAYLIPGFARQRDPSRAAYLVNQLERQGIEIQRRTSGDSAGDFVIVRDQPYGDLVANLLGTQHYPQSAKYPPYDDIAWTLGDQYGVSVTGVNDTAVFHWSGLERVTDTVAAPGVVTGSTAGTVYLVSYRGQADVVPGLYALRDLAPGVRAFAAETAFVAGSDTFPAGSVVIEGAHPEPIRIVAQRYGLTIQRVAAAPAMARHLLDLPRVAIYHSWYSTQDAGWARYTFEQYGIPFTSIDKDDLRRGGLRARFDVILVPSFGGSVTQMINGVDRKWGPLPYQKTKDTPNLGTPFSSPDITGGPGFAGVAELQRFVDAGGTLVTLGAATTLASETGIARPLSPHRTSTLFHPGSIVRARVLQRRSPILYGYPDVTTVFRGNGPLFEVADRDSAFVVLQYGATKKVERDEGPMLGIPDTAPPPARAKPDSTKAAPPREEAYVVSGMVRNEKEIVGEGAIFDVPVRSGRVIAFSFDPLHRFLNHHEFPLVWNALANWNDRP